MRLIDADALMEIYAKYEFTSDMGDAMEILDNAPTVDVVPVIRCKDCKYWNGSGKYCDYEMSGLENDFCSWAERKEE